ncbi:hypothetical protein NDU88_001823 [Pleurodeles waltl]|uniref:Uncharacterized protein n=1 Tax=Pleurodeles waltl TaxID=8319 RepID=A0AAV7SBY1_PLEWA|nr:hypothetical protein NDU88_001823 [Pleurodeles waltl]
MGFARRTPKGPASSAEILAHMAASLIKDHEYGSFPALEVPETGMESSIQSEEIPLSVSHSSGSNQEHDAPKPSGKRKCKLHVADKGQFLLGWAHIKELDIKLDPARDPPVYVVHELIDVHLECNTIADGLSRLPIDDMDEDCKNGDCDVAFTYDDAVTSIGSNAEVEYGMLTEQDWEREMLKDVDMQLLKRFIINGWPH